MLISFWSFIRVKNKVINPLNFNTYWLFFKNFNYFNKNSFCKIFKFKLILNENLNRLTLNRLKIAEIIFSSFGANRKQVNGVPLCLLLSLLIFLLFTISKNEMTLVTGGTCERERHYTQKQCQNSAVMMSHELREIFAHQINFLIYSWHNFQSTFVFFSLTPFINSHNCFRSSKCDSHSSVATKKKSWAWPWMASLALHREYWCVAEINRTHHCSMNFCYDLSWFTSKNLSKNLDLISVE